MTVHPFDRGFMDEFFSPIKYRTFSGERVEGNGTKDEKITVKVGETVLYGKYSGTEINIDGTDYLIMKESDIFGIV